MPPQPSPKGQQGAPEIVATYPELIDEYRESTALARQQSLIDNIVLRKQKAALIEKDEMIAGLDALVTAKDKRIAELEAALLDASTKAPVEAKPARQKQEAG